MKTKERVQDLLGRLPEDCSMDDVLYHLYVIRQIDRGLADVEAGRTIPHEEVLEPARGRRRDRSRWRLPATRRTPDIRSAPSRAGPSKSAMRPRRRWVSASRRCDAVTISSRRASRASSSSTERFQTSGEGEA